MAIIKRKGNEGLMPSMRSNLMEMFDIDRFMDTSLFDSPFWDTRKFSRIPAANIVDLEKEFVVEIAAPGMKKSDFHVDINNGMLEIKVEQRNENVEKEKEYTRKEYDYTSFCRSFALPENIKSEKINAEYREGILKVHLPKVELTKKPPIKEIPVS